MTALLFLLLLHPLTARADAGLTLAGALSEAHTHSPALAKAKALSSEAGWRKLDALAGNLPKLSASANHFFDEKYQTLNINFGGAPITFPEIYPQTTISLNASWTVFDGFSTPFAFAAANLNKAAADLDLARAEITLDSDVQLRFYQALGAQLLANVAEQNLKTLQDHLQKTRDLLNRGKSTKFDTLRVEVQLAEAGPDKLAADDNVVLTRQALSVAMGLDSDDRPLTGLLPVPSQLATPELKPDASARSDIQALLDRAAAADKLHAAALGTSLPRVSLGAEKQYYNNTDKSLNFGNSAVFRDAYNVGIFLTWNLFDGGALLARQYETVYQREQAESQARMAVLHAPLDIKTWNRRLLYNIALYGARLRAIESAEESVRLAKLSYGAGTRTSTDVLDAELDLFRARAGVVRAQVDTAEARLNLELALGRHL